MPIMPALAKSHSRIRENNGTQNSELFAGAATARARTGRQSQGKGRAPLGGNCPAQGRTDQAGRGQLQLGEKQFAFGPKRALAGAWSHLIGDHLKSQELGSPESRGYSCVGGVASARHHNSANAWPVVARIHRMPVAIEKDVKPGAEIHGCRIGGDSDVSKIAGAIARRNVEATAQRDGQVRKVAADPFALGVTFGGCAGGFSILISEGDALMGLVQYRFHPSPAGLKLAEKGPCLRRHPVGIAIAAA